MFFKICKPSLTTLVKRGQKINARAKSSLAEAFYTLKDYMLGQPNMGPQVVFA
jgi:hypothetical protein